MVTYPHKSERRKVIGEPPISHAGFLGVTINADQNERERDVSNDSDET